MLLILTFMKSQTARNSHKSPSMEMLQKAWSALLEQSLQSTSYLELMDMYKVIRV